MLCYRLEKNISFLKSKKILMFMGKKRKSLRYCRNYLRLHFIIIIKTLCYPYNYFYSATNFSTSQKTDSSHLVAKKSLCFLCCNTFNKYNFFKNRRILYWCCFKSYKKILKPLTFRWSQIT